MKTLEEMIALINGWETWRDADESEYIYDLCKEDDYNLWASMYGEHTAERCKEFNNKLGRNYWRL